MDTKVDFQNEIAILTQKNEFLVMELEESILKEENFKKQYEKLQETINQQDMSFMNEKTLTQMKRAADEHAIELEKTKYQKNEVIERLEKQLKEVNLEKLELELDLKKLKVVSERRELDFQTQLQEVRSQKQSLETELKDIDNNAQSNQSDMQNEMDNLQNELSNVQHDLSNAQDQLSAKEHQVNELTQLASFDNLRKLLETIDQKDVSIEQKDAQISDLSKKLEVANAASTRREKCKQCHNLMQKLCHMTELTKETQRKLETTRIQKEKLHVDLDRALLELNQQRLELSTSATTDTTLHEENMKTEVQYLVEKLRNAKKSQNSSFVGTRQASRRGPAQHRREDATRSVSPWDVQVRTNSTMDRANRTMMDQENYFDFSYD